MDHIKRVAVTGGSGKAGKWVIADLLEHNYQVINLDQRSSSQVRTYQVDLCDAGQVYGVLEGQEAVVHLAAINWPGEHSPEVVYRNNVMSSFNILQAARLLGIRKVVLAGSESALGFPFMSHAFGPHCLPIDETHPLLAQDAYGISKIVIEDTARGFVRREPLLSIISLRLSYIIPPDLYQHELSLAQGDPAHNAFNLWAYVDARDMACAFRLAIEHDLPGFDAMYIAAPDILMRCSTIELVERYYPKVERILPGFGGRMSPLDCSHAAQTLGFKAQYTWDTMVAL